MRGCKKKVLVFLAIPNSDATNNKRMKSKNREDDWTRFPAITPYIVVCTEQFSTHLYVFFCFSHLFWLFLFFSEAVLRWISTNRKKTQKEKERRQFHFESTRSLSANAWNVRLSKISYCRSINAAKRLSLQVLHTGEPAHVALGETFMNNIQDTSFFDTFSHFWLLDGDSPLMSIFSDYSARERYKEDNWQRKI